MYATLSKKPTRMHESSETISLCVQWPNLTDYIMKTLITLPKVENVEAVGVWVHICLRTHVNHVFVNYVENSNKYNTPYKKTYYPKLRNYTKHS